jgi:hypothetical protein
MKTLCLLGCLWVAFSAVNSTANGSESGSGASETCHAIKYDSYFVAQNVKDNLKHLNPEVTHPNFSQHFLLMRTELVMETLYLIADCKTGEFFHEKLTGDGAKFSEATNQVILTDKKSGSSTSYEWDGRSWIRGETIDNPAAAEAVASKNIDPAFGAIGASAAGQTAAANKTASASLAEPTHSTAAGNSAVVTPVQTPSLVTRYDELFAHYPSPVSELKCAPLQYSDFFRAQNNQKIIPKLNPNLNQPNFAGNQLLLRTEAMFDVIYLLADCKTGKFFDDYLTGELSFHQNSRLVLVKSSSTKPKLMVWSDSQFIQVPDTVLNSNASVSNTLYGEKASLLLKNLPNPHHVDTVRFENLKRTPELTTLFDALGVETITSGTCRAPHGKSPVCDVEVK